MSDENQKNKNTVKKKMYTQYGFTMYVVSRVDN